MGGRVSANSAFILTIIVLMDTTPMMETCTVAQESKFATLHAKVLIMIEVFLMVQIGKKEMLLDVELAVQGNFSSHAMEASWVRLITHLRFKLIQYKGVAAVNVSKSGLYPLGIHFLSL